MNNTIVNKYDDIHFHYTTSGSSRQVLDMFIKYVTDIASTKFPGVGQLEHLHKHCHSSKVNELRLLVFQHINNHYDWKQAIAKSIGPSLITILGPNVYIQKKVNISIQLPQDCSSILPMHSDCMSGDSPFQLNLWIPLTRAYGSNTMFLVERETSLRLMCQQIKMFTILSSASREQMLQVIHDCNNIPSSKKYYVHAQPGDFLVFNPAVLHGNELNTTTSTRVSLNVRLTTIGAPTPLAKDSDRSFFNYYEPLLTSKSHAFGMSVYSALETGMQHQ